MTSNVALIAEHLILPHFLSPAIRKGSNRTSRHRNEGTFHVDKQEDFESVLLETDAHGPPNGEEDWKRIEEEGMAAERQDFTSPTDTACQ